MAEQRAEFEAWAKQAGWPHHATMPINKGPDYFSDMSLAVWQAATQRQQEHIAELQAQVQALSMDAARYQFLRAGGAYLEPNSEEIYMATDDGGKYYHDRRDLDMDIDTAIARATHKEGA